MTLFMFGFLIGAIAMALFLGFVLTFNNDYFD